MKKVFYTFFALLFVSPLFGRVICATTTGDFNMRKLSSGTYLIRISGLKGACKVLNSH